MALQNRKYAQMMLTPDDKRFGATDDELRAEAKAHITGAYGAGWVFVHEQRDAVEDPAHTPGTFIYTSMWAPPEVKA